MEHLITSGQGNKLKAILDDQKISIENIEVHFDEVTPIENETGIIRKHFSFNDWAKNLPSPTSPVDLK